MTLQHLKFPFFLLAIGTLSGLGSGAQATDSAQPTDSAQSEEGAQYYAQTVQTCQSGGFPSYYVRIQTNNGDALKVRSTPAGTAIGLIPNGWAVRVLEWSRNGYWVKVTSHFESRGGPQTISFGSAPEFREGWVSAGYVKDLGRFCEKPEAAAMLLQPEVFGARPVEVQGDWLAMGDGLAKRLLSPQLSPH